MKSLLDRDKSSQETELKSMRTNRQDSIGGGVLGVNSLEALKNRVEVLKSAREESRRKLAEQKLYENWRINNPELREMESKKLEEHVVGAWSDQIKEKHELSKIEKRETDEYLAYLELERQRQEDRDEELRRRAQQQNFFSLS